MTRKAMAICALVLIAFVMIQAGCKPVTYYLERTYKVHGTVTEAETSPPVALVSVEVFVGEYQYSELTNYYGDYEMELPAGTWTIRFVKAGYETVEAQVTVGPDSPRVQLDMRMTRIVTPPPEINLTGYWDTYRIEDGEEHGPDLDYILQEGSTLITHHFTGTVDGLNFTLEGWLEDWDVWYYIVQTGTISNDGNSIEGYVYIDGNLAGEFTALRSTMPFGRLDLEGAFGGLPISIHTDYAVGAHDYMMFPKNFTLQYLDHEMKAYFQFGVSDFPVGVDSVEVGLQIKWKSYAGEEETLLDWVIAETASLTVIRLDDERVQAINLQATSRDIYGNLFTLSGSFDVPLMDIEF